MTVTYSSSAVPPTTVTAILRGARGRCPSCGRASLLQRYLKPVASCLSCGEGYGHIRADDMPPWLTILIVGHIVVPLILLAEQQFQPALWLQWAVWPTVTLALTLALLPFCKGAVIGLMWATGAQAPDPD